jgi:uncharacterized membrane protein YbhN (UPF0104 family)
VLVRIAATALLLAIVLFAIDRLVPGARARLAHAGAGWLAAAVGLELIACAAYVILFQAVFSRAPWLVSLRRGIEIALAEVGGFAIVPTGLGGPAIRIWALRAGGMPWRALISRSISHGVIFNVPYTAAAIVLGVGLSLHLVPGHAPTLTALAPLALVLGALTLACGAFWFARRRSSAESPRGQRLRSAVGMIPEGIADMRRALARPASLPGAIGWWAGDCAALWASFQAVGGRPALSVVILAYMLGQLGNTLPLPGGVGGVEPLMLGILASSSVNPGLAAAAIVCYRTIALGVQGGVGAIAFVVLATGIRGRPDRSGEAAPSLRAP